MFLVPTLKKNGGGGLIFQKFVIYKHSTFLCRKVCNSYVKVSTLLFTFVIHILPEPEYVTCVK